MKKGNRTLELKVIDLQERNEKLKEELNKAAKEIYKLQMKIFNIERNKKESKDLFIDYFGGVFTQISDLITENK